MHAQMADYEHVQVPPMEQLRRVLAAHPHRTPVHVATAIVDLALTAADAVDTIEATADPTLAVAVEVADQLRSIPQYVCAMRDALPAHLVTWVIERLVQGLLRAGDAAGVVSARDPNEALIAHVVGPMDRMLDETSPDPDLVPIGNARLYHIIRSGSQGTERPTLCATSGSDTAWQFHGRTNGLLKGVLGPHVVAAGGSVLNAACHETKRDNDVDLFFVGYTTASEADAGLRQALSRLLSNAIERYPGAEARLRLMPGVVTLELRTDKKMMPLVYQFIKRAYTCIEQVLLSFDLDVCKWLLDGSQNVWCTRSAVRSARAQTFVVNPLMATTAARYTKYVGMYKWHCVVPRFEGLAQMVGEISITHDAPAQLRQLVRRNTLMSIYAARMLKTQTHWCSQYQGISSGELTVSVWCPYTPLQRCTENGVDMLSRMHGPESASLLSSVWEIHDPCKRMYVMRGDTFLS
jgi:hypothetical protein